MPYIKPISWSQYWCYKNKPDEFYQQYILGLQGEQSREMLLGNIIHSGWEGKDWLTQLKENNYTADFERTVGEIMKFNMPQFPEKECWLGQKGLYYDETDCTIAGRADGRDKDKHIILEIKTGKHFWNQERADETEQITLYSFLHLKEFGVIPEFLLVSCNVSNGKVKMFNTKRTQEQIDRLCQDIKQVVGELKAKNWWEIRV